MTASDGFAEFLRDQLTPLGRITMRRMFGKTGVFCDGFMLGMVRDNTLYFRVDDDNRVAFKEAEAFPPLNYEKKGGPSIFRFGALRSVCSRNPMSLSPGRERRWRRHGGLLRREHLRREGENHSLNFKSISHVSSPFADRTVRSRSTITGASSLPAAMPSS
jgi:TfoX/Sxy family transcriptional regulator of competence genes